MSPRRASRPIEGGGLVGRSPDGGGGGAGGPGGGGGGGGGMLKNYGSDFVMYVARVT